MRSKRWELAVPAAVLLCALALSGCTTSTTTDNTTTGTSGAATSNLGTSAPSSAGGPPSSSSPAASSAAASTATTSGPWPADLTPDQVAQAQAALAVYTAYTKLIDQAFTDPGRDWSTEVTKLATDPEKSNFLKSLAGTAALGQYGDGALVIDPRVVKVEPGVVTLLDCVDSTNVGFYDNAGNSIKAPDAPGSYLRHPSTVTVAEFQGGDQGDQWLVFTVVDDYNRTC